MKIIFSTLLSFFAITLLGQIHHIGMVNGHQFLSGFDQSMILANSPDGRFVYAVGKLDASISIYQRDILSGHLTCMEEVTNYSSSFGLNEISEIVISPDGLNMYMSGPFDAEIILFERNILTGSIEPKSTTVFSTSEKMKGIDFLKFNPDGNFLYAISYHDDVILSYSRNAENGTLEFLEKINNIQEPEVFLSGASSLDISPDGQYLYATAFEDAAINVFHINEKTGKLKFIESKLNSFEGIEGLKGAKHLKVSPDGRNVYVAGFLDSAIVIFERSKDNGRLVFLEVIRNYQNEMNALLGIQQIEMNPDGSELYVTSTLENSLTVYQRDVLTGLLEFDKTQQEYCHEIKDRFQSLEMSLSPNGKNIYLSGFNNNGIDIFDRTYFIKETQNICQKDLINMSEISNMVAGIYLDTILMPNSIHIIETHLTVTASTENQFIELCQGERFSIGDNEYSEPGIYTTSMSSDLGCDVEMTFYLSYKE